MQPYAETFKVLSDETRLRIVRLLSVARAELCVCELTDALEVPQYNISRHLKELKTAGLVTQRKEGRWAYFSITKEGNPFIRAVLKSLSLMHKPQFKKDRKELKKRLKLRTRGKCLTGIQKKHLRT